jgi:hypothetical protein
MALVRRPGLSLFAKIREVIVGPVASAEGSAEDCARGDHRWDLIDKMGVPPLWKCVACGVHGFVRRKGHGLRNGRMVEYKCSTSDCRGPGKIRSRHRGAGGAYEWACETKHAQGSRFDGRR